MKFRWRQGNDILFEMSESVQAVLIDDKIYIGGGFTMYTVDVGIVLMYTLRNGSWTKLPYYRNHFCGMTAVNQQLVLVGDNLVLLYDEP